MKPSRSSSHDLRAMLSNDVDPRAIDAGWERISARRDRKRRSSRAPMLLVPALVLVTALAFVLRTFVFTPHAPPPLNGIALVGGAPLPDELAAPSAAPSAAHVVALDDGSRLELDARARLRRTPKRGADPQRVELTLESGGATFDIKPGGPRMWVIDAGPVAVRVLGTRFHVERDGSVVGVSVERGKVSIEGPGIEGGAKLLTAGESIRVGTAVNTGAAPAMPSSTSASMVEAPAVETNTPASNTPAAASNTAATFARPAARTNNASAPRDRVPARASTASPTVGGARSGESASLTAPTTTANAASTDETTGRALVSNDAMASADAARRAGRPRDAVAILTSLVDRDARAPLAAFTLGKIHAEDLGDPATAAVWFERAMALGLPRGLDEEANARAVECHAKAGRRVDAVRAAARYEAAFPNGRHLERVRALIRN